MINIAKLLSEQLSTIPHTITSPTTLNITIDGTLLLEIVWDNDRIIIYDYANITKEERYLSDPNLTTRLHTIATATIQQWENYRQTLTQLKPRPPSHKDHKNTYPIPHQSLCLTKQP